MSTQKCEIGAPYGVAEEKLPASFTDAASALVGFVTQIVAGFIRYRSFKAAEKELQALDDRMLKDIGVTRSEIRSTLIDACNERRNTWRI